MKRTFFWNCQAFVAWRKRDRAIKGGCIRILPARFLYRDKKHVKSKIDPEGGRNPKVELCVGGQRDPDLKVRELAVDVPTASRHSVLIGLQFES